MYPTIAISLHYEEGLYPPNAISLHQKTPEFAFTESCAIVFAAALPFYMRKLGINFASDSASPPFFPFFPVEISKFERNARCIVGKFIQAGAYHEERSGGCKTLSTRPKEANAKSKFREGGTLTKNF